MLHPVEEDLIKKYLSECFRIEINNDINIIGPLNCTMDYNELIGDINYMFCMFNSTHICKEWYNTSIRNIIGDIFDFLNSCKLRLGRTEWLVYDSNGNIITEDKMVEYFTPQYGEKFVSKYFTDWKMDEMIKETERTMGFNY